jgi:PIN domain nuclease of toxin-antitoxin system
MKFILDTHVWLWMIADPDRLSSTTARLMEHQENELLLSAASSWEIAIKYSLGKLDLPSDPSRYVPEQILETGVTPLPVEHSHALRVASLPRHHQDPFDRLIIAQAELEQATLITADQKFSQYGIPIQEA